TYAQLIVTDHFDLLAKRQFPRLEQLLACNETELHQARALIRTLDPRPGRCYAKDDARYVLPDVIVVPKGKTWEAKINPAVQPSIRLNQAYAELAGRRGAAPSCSHMLQEARWLLRNISQRFDTIQRVAEAIVKRQKVFFAHGEAAMKPLSLKDIAGEVGLHESTVCRVSNGKYMATPQGLFEFKYFFSRQLRTEAGRSFSTMAIRALIKELVAAEDPHHPLSDVQLTKLLTAQGFKLVRRTVTKYRSQLRIPSVELRRVLA
ncbi:MAG TPA: RNA polymerase factor sigma-54, partial [Rhodocyclaceae bacterium]|nr:RNA polymerase factor sigma-54 [Rhodocyclaceae bacterium]